MSRPQNLNRNNAILTATNLYALRAVSAAFSRGYHAVGVALCGSMVASMSYHWVERTYRQHPHMGGKNLIGRGEREEQILLGVDRALSLVGLVAVIHQCSSRTVWEVATGPHTFWMPVAAVCCAFMGEIKQVNHLELGGINGYAFLHSAWHILVYHLPLVCIQTSRK